MFSFCFCASINCASNAAIVSSACLRRSAFGSRPKQVTNLALQPLDLAF